MSSVKEIFDEECSTFKADKKLFKEICDLENGFVTKRPEHVEFFGGVTTGVQVVRFTQDDMDKLFNDIIQVDEGILEERVHALDDIDTNYIVSSNIFNIACVWLTHRVMTSQYLDEKARHEAAVRVMLYLNYRFLTSILYRFFKYPANPETAARTYEELSSRYLLKAKGSWSAALRSRCEDIVSKDSIHYKTLMRLDNDYAIVTMLNDIQGRIKDIIKNIYSVFIHVHNQGSKISKTSALTEFDGELILKDKEKSQASYARYLKSIVPDKNSFFKQELFDIVCTVVDTAPPHFTLNTLNWISENYNFIKDGSVERAIDDIMEHAFAYLSKNKGVLRHKQDVSEMLVKMRGTYTSSRGTDELLMKIKEDVEKIVVMATRSKNKSVVSAVRTAVCLYILLRSFTMKHYQSK